MYASLYPQGTDITIVGSGHATLLASQAASALCEEGVEAEVIDLRVLNPFDATLVVESVQKTRHLLVVDAGWLSAGFSAEVIARVCEQIVPGTLLSAPQRIAYPDAPAPTSRVLEKEYYISIEEVVNKAIQQVSSMETKNL